MWLICITDLHLTPLAHFEDYGNVFVWGNLSEKRFCYLDFNGIGNKIEFLSRKYFEFSLNLDSIFFASVMLIIVKH